MSQTMQFENNFREAIVSTIAFFDLFDYPLTPYEIYKYSEDDLSLSEIISFLEQEIDQADALIRQKNGFYFLIGREEITATRQKRHNYTRRKIKIARRFCRLLKICPFVSLVAVANLIGDNNLRDQSDIDFFIITAPRRLWLARLYCAGLAKILNLRPTAKNKKDKICLSFYVSADHLNLNDLRLSGADPYFDYWRRGLILLYDKEGIYVQFLEKNGLSKKSDSAPRPIKKKSSHTSVLISFFFNFLERLAKKIQLKIMPAALNAAVNNSDGVVVSDTVLKLYLRDHRREYAEKYGNKINEILKKND
jgi:hypothetical protein